MAWQVQEAKQRFSELVRKAVEEGPQVVTRHGEEVVVVLSAKEYLGLAKKRRSFREFLLNGPDISALDLRRPKEWQRAREIEL